MFLSGGAAERDEKPFRVRFLWTDGYLYDAFLFYHMVQQPYHMVLFCGYGVHDDILRYEQAVNIRPESHRIRYKDGCRGVSGSVLTTEWRT